MHAYDANFSPLHAVKEVKSRVNALFSASAFALGSRR
jgi:hypothetical protein